MIKSEIQELQQTVNELQTQLQKSDSKVDSLVYELRQFLANAKEANSCPELRREWIPKDEVKQFLQFAHTRLSAITKNYNIVHTKIGNRTFYNVNSLKQILEANQRN